MMRALIMYRGIEKIVLIDTCMRALIFIEMWPYIFDVSYFISGVNIHGLKHIE